MKATIFAALMTVMIVAAAAMADVGRMIAEPAGTQRVQIFAPDFQYDYLMNSPAVLVVPAQGFMAVAINSTVDCQMWKSDTASRAGKVAIPVTSGGFIRGVNPSVKFFIYSGCNGPIERQ